MNCLVADYRIGPPLFQSFSKYFFLQEVNMSFVDDASGADKRRIKRWYLTMYLRVYDRDTNDLIGQIVDINKDGMRLVGDNPLPLNKVFRLWVDIPQEDKPRQRLELEAESLWTGRDINPDFYDTGFRVLGIDTQALLQLQLLIEEFRFG